MKLRGSVIIVTWNRPDYITKCLQKLLEQTPPPDQIVVVDASATDDTRKAVEQFPGVVYAFNEQGRGNTPHSRNVGILHSIGDILIFLDDDAFVHPGWFKTVIETYGEDPQIGGVVPRILDNLPGEETDGMDDIGALKPNGVLHNHFAANPGKIIEVDHMLGACMTFRREAVARVGGFHGDYPGTNACDDSDMCLRVKLAGYRLLFNPAAAVDHVRAPRAVGKRFDSRYLFYHRCNNFMMFLRNYGFQKIFWGYLLFIIKQTVTEFVRKIGGALLTLAVSVAGTITGIVRGTGLLVAERRNPTRHDAPGLELTRYLERENPAFRDSAPIEQAAQTPR